MATVVNNPPPRENPASAISMIVALLLLLLVGFLFYSYGIPTLRGGNSSPQINVPDEIDVNVNNGNQGTP